MNKICIFGDSLVWGACDDIGGGWAERLRQYVNKKRNGDSEVYVLGVCGDKSKDLLKRIEVENEARDPDMVIIAIGTNDLLAGIEKDEFKRNVGSIIDIVKRKARQIKVLGINRIKKYNNKRIEEFNKILSDVCKIKKVKFIDVMSVVDDSDFVDEVHPNSKAHKKLFDLVKDQLK